MSEFNLWRYKEDKPHYLRMVVWRIYNIFVFPLLPRFWRVQSLRMFGAKVGRGCLFRRLARFYAPWNFQCGDAVCIGPCAQIYNKCQVKVGSSVVISQDAWLCTAGHDILSLQMDLNLRPIQIGNKVWIAAKAIILPGVSIGEGAVVGAGAVVAKDVPPWSVVVGNPARVVKKRVLNEA